MMKRESEFNPRTETKQNTNRCQRGSCWIYLPYFGHQKSITFQLLLVIF